MFKKNDVSNEQLELFSKEESWTKYQQKRINDSWIGYFHDHIFPIIDEEPYRILYSDNIASCPNTPVNILISLLIIKSLTNKTDEEIIDALLFDQRIQYAVHTLNEDKQHISKNMLGNFRRKIMDYEISNGINLFDETMHKLNDAILKLHNIDRTIERMDSMMISSSCKKLSRIELVYTVNYNFIKYLKTLDKVPTELECYLEEKHKNEVIYRTKDVETSDKLSTLLSSSLKLYNEFKDDKEVSESNEFKILERLINDQYDTDNNKPKDNKDIKPTSLQTPSDPEATYRYKYKGNIGYVGNIVEATNNEAPMITDWDVNCNTKSDVEFIKEYIEKKETNNGIKTEIVDGAYYSEEIKKIGEDKGIEIHPTELVGKKVDNKNLLDFKIGNENYQVLECPNKVKPISSKYNEKNHTICAKFEKEKCSLCPFKDKCIISTNPKKSNTLKVSIERINNAVQKAKNNNLEYQKVSNMRAGIEGIPSLMRRKYGIDTRPIKGKVYLKMVFSASMISINIKRASNILNSTLNNVVIFLHSKLFDIFSIFSSNFSIILNF